MIFLILFALLLIFCSLSARLTLCVNIMREKGHMQDAIAVEIEMIIFYQIQLNFKFFYWILSV